MDEFKNSLSHFLDRLKSPFGGTFIFVWIITHWEFMYYLFFVSSDVTAEERIINFKFFFQGGIMCRFFLDVIKPSILTFFAIGIYHIATIIAGVISGYFKRHLEPKIAKELGTGETILRSELDIELNKKAKIEQELILCQENRTADFTRSTNNENTLKDNIRKLEIHLHNLTKLENENQEKLKSALGSKTELINLMYLERMNELKFMKFRNISQQFLIERMLEKSFNFYFDKKTDSFISESFSLKSPNIYLVDDKPKYHIENVKLNTKFGLIYFEKRGIDGELIYLNEIIAPNNNSQVFEGFEFNVTTQNTYKILYSNIHLSEFQSYSDEA